MNKIPEDVFKTLTKIQIQTKKAVESLFAGAYLSVFKGKGMEFDEVREYHTGDDIRTIDWNVTARMNTPFVKTFQEERELTVMLLIDISASLHFGSIKETKKELLTKVGAILAMSAIENQDRVGVLFFSETVEKYIPPKKGKKHGFRIIRDLYLISSKEKKTDIANALAFFGKVQKKSTICFLLSDFLTSDFEKEARLVGKKHDFIGIRIFDPLENDFPSLGPIEFKDLETLENKMLDTSADGFSSSFFEERKKRWKRQKKSIIEAGGDFIEISLGSSLIEQMKTFFQKRKKRFV